MNYKVRISQRSYVENDPNFKCKIYDAQKSYSQCLENEFQRQLGEYIACSPPWLVDNKDRWWNNSLHIINEKIELYKFTIENILEQAGAELCQAQLSLG